MTAKPGTKTSNYLVYMPFSEPTLPEEHPEAKRFSSFDQVQTPRTGRILARWCGALGLVVVLCGLLP